jgi:hypothetical protein
MYFKDLTKSEKKHLKETAGVTTLSAFKVTARYMADRRKEYIAAGHTHMEPCYECKAIARKLGLPV